MPDHHAFSALDRHAVLGGSDNGFPWYAGAMLAFEASEVVRLRCEKLSRGDEAAGQEAVLMVREKIAAGFEAAMSLLAGATAGTIVQRYREQVAANAKRLSAEEAS
ncbi:hypothetical protein ACU4GH_09765 [Bradyrhizobium betae]